MCSKPLRLAPGPLAQSGGIGSPGPEQRARSPDLLPVLLLLWVPLKFGTRGLSSALRGHRGSGSGKEALRWSL